MKLINKISPKRLFGSKKTHKSLSRSDTSSSSTSIPDTPTSILPATSDNKVTLTQLESLLTRIQPDPPTREEITQMLTEFDVDNNGCISLEAKNDELREAFEVFDRDCDGKITAEELHEVFVGLLGDEGCGLEECRRMVAEVGTSGVGFVCFEDFKRMMELQR